MRGITQELFNIITSQRDGEAASMHLLNKYTSDESVKMYSTWSRVRQQIAKHPEFRNKYYISRLEELMKDPDLPAEDYLLLNDLKTSSLQYQHRVQSSNRKFLSSEKHDKWLHHIPALIYPVYNFTIPKEIAQARKLSLANRAKDDQTHDRKGRSYYKFSNDQLENWIEIAKVMIRSLPIRTVGHYYEVILGIQLLSGRRNSEVIKTLQLGPVPGYPYQAWVLGIAKRDVHDQVEDRIPLLDDFDALDHALKAARDYKSFDGDCSVMNSRVGGSLSKAAKRLFNQNLTHTQKRNIYAEMAWRKRENQNMFCIGEESCCRTVWFSRALAHRSLPVVTLSNRYDNLVIENTGVEDGIRNQ